MRTIVTAVVVLATFSGMAQENLNLPLPKYYKEDKQSNISMIQPDLHKKSLYFFSLRDSTNDYEVVTLKQDGMPCIVPNMRKFNTMPNATKPADVSTLNNKPGAIPNPLLGQKKPKVRPFIKPNTDKKGS